MDKGALMQFADKLTFLGNKETSGRALDVNWLYSYNPYKVEPIYYKFVCVLARKFCKEVGILPFEEIFNPDTDEYLCSMDAELYFHSAFDTIIHSVMQRSKYWSDNGFWSTEYYFPFDDMQTEVPKREVFEKYLKGEYPVGDERCEVENAVCLEFSNDVFEWCGCNSHVELAEPAFLDVLYDTLDIMDTPECCFRFSALISEGLKIYLEFAEKNKSLIKSNFQREHELLLSIVHELRIFVIANYPDNIKPVCLTKGDAIVIGWIEGMYYTDTTDSLQYNVYLPYLILISDALLDKAINIFNLDIKPYKKTFTLSGMDVTIED